METLIRQISRVLVILVWVPLVVSCRHDNRINEKNMQDKQLKLMSFTRSGVFFRNVVSADSLFNCDCILQGEGSSFAFVFDGSCSTCVSEAIDFIATLAVSGLSTEIDVRFFSKSEGNDVFYYYLKRDLSKIDSLGKIPWCYSMIERDDVPNGLYRIDNGMVINYMPWHY